ncbi:twin-arginine translocation signal domain-containing protein [Acidovorax sp.]|uniref:twin-arginine translocation signal domain-containing protein n=1 Tax=Acidovorax sp. TaxID=1872122 RepID=UPI00261FFDA3|nr:twin-arginine translocation signal domain-containing protein [Acidovorax sp.]
MRVISIAPTPPRTSACNDEHGEIVDTPRLALPLVRRDFLKGSGILMGTIAAGSALAALAPSSAWAVELKTLSQSHGKALMAMGRVLFPHKKLPDAVYALLAKDLDAKASADPATRDLLREGIAQLDKAGFAKGNTAGRLAIVKAMEGSPFFNAVRGQCVTSIYDNDMAFKVFGYPGASWDKGGYITRGFQDLKWLQEPPKEASPPAYMG